MTKCALTPLCFNSTLDHVETGGRLRASQDDRDLRAVRTRFADGSTGVGAMDHAGARRHVGLPGVRDGDPSFASP